MRYLFVFVILLGAQSVWSQGSGFSFSYTGPTQILVGLSCEAPLQWGHPNTPTATSNIPGGMIVSFTIYSISGGYEIGDLVPGGTTVTVFYQALDNFGNTALFGFNISFVDLIPPSFDQFSLPPNITVTCVNQVPPPANVEATDNCENDNANLTITYTQNGNPAICTGGTITRTWVADDDLGNFATYIQTITVAPDNTPPVIADNLQNGTAPCSTAMAQYTTWLNTQRANFTATDNGCGLLSKTDNAPSPAIITSFCGAIDVTFTATDNCNNTSTVVRTFTVTNNVPPVITTPATGSSGNCSQSNIASVFNTWIMTHGGAAATDDCSSIFWSTFPPNPSINDTCDAAIDVMFIAGDGCNNFDTTMASFILTDDTAPTFTADPSTSILSCTTNNLDSLLTVWLVNVGNSEAQDLCTAEDDLVTGYRISGSDLTFEEVLDAWQDSLAAGCRDNVFIGGIGLNNVLGYIPVEFTYTDKCNNTAGKIGYFGITDNGRPVFVTPPADSSFACSQTSDWEEVFMGWYNSAGGATYMDACSDVTVQASITADSAIQYLTAALDTACLQGVEVAISFGLTDACGNTSLMNPSATFSLQDTIAPMLTSPAQDLIIGCAADATVQLQNWLDTLAGMEASDGCGALSWQFTWADTAGNIQTGSPGTGPYPSLAGLDCDAGLDVIITAFDICQNSVSDTALFSIIDTIPPSIEIVEDTLILGCLDTIPSTPPVVSDACDTSPFNSYADSVSVDSCLGLPVWIIRTWTATDDCGNASTSMQTFLRLDTIAPTFDLPADTVAFCTIDTLSLLNVADNCDPSPVVTWQDELTGPACQQTLNRLWIVTDACGNSATAMQSFDLSDTTAPFVVFTPGDYLFTCDTSSGPLQEAYENWQDSVTIDDACSESAYFIAIPGSYDPADTMTWPGTPLPDSVMTMCGNTLKIEADLVAYDVCGNVLIQPISFTVVDTVGPSFINCPTSLVVPADTTTCDAIVTLSPPAYEELCFPDDVTLFLIINGGDTLQWDTLLSPDTLLPVGIHTLEWIATDCNLNVGTCTTSLTVLDEEALNVFCPADTTFFTDSLSCQLSVIIAAPQTVTGSCGLGASQWFGYIDGDATPSSFTFDDAGDTVQVVLQAGLHTVFLVAQDSTGDQDTCAYLITVQDTFAPIILCQADTLFLTPSGLDTIDLASTQLLASASDPCGIDTVTYNPQQVTCEQNGQLLAVTVTVTDANGNTAVCQTTLLVMTEPLMPLWQSQLCDDTLRLFANLPAGPDSIFSFAWTGPNGFLSNEQNPVIPDADTSNAGLYELTVTSETGCISSGSTSVLIQELNALTILASADTLCAGDTFQLTTQPFAGDIQYQWFHALPAGDTLIGVTMDPSFEFAPSAPGSFDIYAIVSEDTCSSEPGIPITLVAIAIPDADIEGDEMILCVDDSLFLMPVTVYDSLTYSWTGPGGFVSNDPTPAGIPATLLEPVSRFFLVTGNGYCTSSADSIEVSVQLPPDTPVITGDTLSCEGGSLILTTLQAHSAYAWIDPQGNIISTNEDTLFIQPVDTSDEGNWQVIVFENGCPSDTSAFFFVDVDTALQIAITAATQVCEGDLITLEISPSVAGDYSWSGPGGFTSDEITPITPAMQGTYTVAVETATGCTATDSIEIDVDVLPVISMLLTDADSCANGMEDIQIWALSVPGYSSGYSYTWTGPGSFTVQDSSIVIEDATAAANGLYTLTIMNGACASETATLELNLTDSPAAPVIGGENVYCDGDTIMLLIENPVTGALYSWTSQDTSVVIASPGTLVIPNASLGWTGIYTVEAVVNGCVSPPTNKAIQVKSALPPPGITSMPQVCEGDSLVLLSTAPDGATYHWISSSGFESSDQRPVIFPVTLNDAGTYQLTYTQDGCTSPPSNPYDIEVIVPPAAPDLLADMTAVCIDQAGEIFICVSSGNLPNDRTITWILNGTSNLVSPGPDSCITISNSQLSGGQNAITAFVTAQGCPSDTSVAILIQGDEFPEQSADAGVDEAYCPGDLIILDGSDPSPGTGVWTSMDPLVILADSTNPQTEVLSLPSGSYTLTWTLSYATCIDYSSDEVGIFVDFAPETLPDTIEVPFGQTEEFIVTLNDTISFGPFTLEIVAAPQRGNALHAGNGIFRYSPNIGFVGTDMLIYRICSVNCPDECSEAVVILKVGNEDDCFVPSLFTPNGDGINDVLIVPCLETSRYPQNKIIIFNEWGDAVFDAAPYQNDWDGTISGEPLPVGTYFYIMDFGDGSEPKRTFLILER